MIQEEFVTFETAKLLKEVGFSEMTMDYYYKGKFNADLGVMTNLWDDWNAQTDIDIVAAPSQSQAMRWLREEKDIFVDIENRYGKGTAQWDFKLVDIDNMDNILEFAKKLEYTYEAAAEAGIQAACEYLIEKGGEE